MKQIIILSELYYPETTSTGYFLTKTAEGLAEEFDVKVIAGPATELFQKTASLPYEIRNKVEIFRCQGTNFDKNFLLGRLLNLITRSLTIFWRSLFLCQKEDKILVVTNPPLLPFIALALKYLKGCNFVLLIHDVYPEVLVATGLFKSSSIVVKIAEIFNRHLYQQAEKIITLGRDMTLLTEAKLSQEEKEKNKIHCLPNWADEDIFNLQDRENNPVLNQLKISDRFVVLYAGNIGRTHGIEYLAEAAKKLKNNPKIYFLVVGFGAKQQWLEKYIREEKLTNITLLSPCPREQLIYFLNAGDLALIAFIPGMAGVSVPSRTYNQMRAGKPIIAVADDWSELANIVREEEIGWIIKPGDIEDLVNKIELAASERQLCQQMGARAATAAKNKYSFALTDFGYKQLFKALYNKQARR